MKILSQGIISYLVSTFLFVGVSVALPQYKVGVPAPLTGNSAAEGHDTQNAFILANEKFGEGQFIGIFEDDQCTPKGGVSAVQKLINISKVDLITGFTCSGPLLAAAPVIEKSKIITIGVATASPLITNAGEHIFRTWPSEAIGAAHLAHYIKKHYDSVGMLTEETEFCRGFADILQKRGKEEELVVEEESFLSSESDFKSLLLKLQQKKISALILNTQSEKNLITTYQQVRAMGWNLPIMGNYYPGSAEFLKTFETSADGIVFSDIPSVLDIGNESAKNFLDDFVKRFGKPQSVEAVVLTTAAAVQVISQAAKQGPNFLENLNKGSFNTVIGKVSFDSNGDIEGFGQVLKEIKSGTVHTIPQ